MKKKPKAIQLVGFDCDGTLTDGSIIMSEQGEIKSFNAKDGYGIVALLRSKKIVVIITARTSKVLAQRAAELGIPHLIQGCKDKKKEFQKLAKTLHIPLDQACFMGDDIPDLPLLKAVGLAAAPRCAHQSVIQSANWVSTKTAGHGAARELCDWIIDEGL